MSKTDKFVEALSLKSFRVQEFETEPFMGVYLGTNQGEHGKNYLFFSEGHCVQVFGTKALYEKMARVKPGFEVKITYLNEVQLKSGNRFHDIKVEHTENKIEGFDVEAHLAMIGLNQGQ